MARKPDFKAYLRGDPKFDEFDITHSGPAD
jgi:hypothetical protein